MMTSTRYLIFSSVVVIALLSYMYSDSLLFLFNHWIGSDDYSHGMFVPLISGFLVWQSRHRLMQVPRERAWWGLGVIFVGLMLYVVGELATLYVVLHLSLWIVIVGLVIALVGIRGAKAIAFPLGYLLTAVPLPVFFYANLSSQLQLWSSSLGVGCLQLVGVMAFREGNVIDLGQVQLQVVEACSGIRYLLPLTSLALLCAYLFKDKMWKRVVLVLSAIPISILINGFRIGMIGVLVELYGKGAAEGFYHLFEGWVIFMVSLAFLIIEMGLLGRIGTVAPYRPFLAQLSWCDQDGEGSQGSALSLPRRILPSLGPAYLCSVAILAPFTLLSTSLVDRAETPPSRAAFIDFPMEVNGWRGERFPLENSISTDSDSTTMCWPIIVPAMEIGSISMRPIINHNGKDSPPIPRRVVCLVAVGKSPPLPIKNCRRQRRYCSHSWSIVPSFIRGTRSRSSCTGSNNETDI